MRLVIWRQMYIYGLRKPGENKETDIRYVGKAENLERRLRTHLRDKSNNYKVHWIQGLRRSGIIPEIFVLEGCGDNWEDREIWWIAYCKSIGCKLTNGTNGGDGISGFRFSEESRKKMRESHKGQVPWNKGKKYLDKYSKIRTSHKGQIAWNKGKKMPREFCEKFVPWNKGKCYSEKEKKISYASRRGIPPWNKGKIASEESKIKMSLAQIGNKHMLGKHHTRESKLKMSISHRGKPTWNKGISATEETKRKMSISQRGKLPWNKGKRKEAKA